MYVYILRIRKNYVEWSVDDLYILYADFSPPISNLFLRHCSWSSKLDKQDVSVENSIAVYLGLD